MKISYCTTCHNRLWQLKQTISHNLTYLKAGEVEWCILAYNDDTVEAWLREHYAEYIADGRIKVKTHYDDYKGSAPFPYGYVKNLSHAMGSGEILFNLDADNFIDNAHDALLILKPYQILKDMSFREGCFGRIGVYRSLFDKVGGYRDVSRSDDGEFTLRCLLSGAGMLPICCRKKPIPNTPES